MAEKRNLAGSSEPKIRGYLARRAKRAIFLYRRRRKESWLITCDYDDCKDEDASKRPSDPKFDVGSRFNGRFYPSRCSLSPNGKHFVYFVMRGGSQSKYDDEHYCWTALCKPPQISAEFLLPHEDTWGGGGKFLDDRNLVVYSGMHHDRADLAALDGQTVCGIKIHVSDTFDETPASARNIKLIDDGWQGTDSWHMLSGRWWKKSGKARLLSRFRDDWQASGEFDSYNFHLVDWKRKPILPNAVMQDFQWADFDRLNRLWVTRGQYIEIYDHAVPGMTAKPNKTIDLERILQKALV